LPATSPVFLVLARKLSLHNARRRCARGRPDHLVHGLRSVLSVAFNSSFSALEMCLGVSELPMVREAGSR